MPVLKMFKRKQYNEIYLLSGEIVTIFAGGIYNYLDTRRSDTWEVGSVTIKDKSVDLGPIPPQNAVREAYEILGYTIKV